MGRWRGVGRDTPYVILERTSEVNYRVEVEKNIKENVLVHVNLLRGFKKREELVQRVTIVAEKKLKSEGTNAKMGGVA